MATLANYFPQNSSTAIIVPGDKPITITYQSLSDQCARFRRKLAAIGIGHGSAVSIALPNSLEFIVRITRAYVANR
jgi:acyl-CoA synthetase (AMP-forming)/AMP-acid ligase II